MSILLPYTIIPRSSLETPYLSNNYLILFRTDGANIYDHHGRLRHTLQGRYQPFETVSASSPHAPDLIVKASNMREAIWHHQITDNRVHAKCHKLLLEESKDLLTLSLEGIGSIDLVRGEGYQVRYHSGKYTLMIRRDWYYELYRFC